MLAWCHAAIVEERELLAALFPPTSLPPPPQTPAPAASHAPGDAPPPAEPPLPTVSDLLTSVVDSVSRPLGVRVEQVCASQASLVTTLRLLDVLAFYTTTLWGLLQHGRGLLAALAGAQEGAAARFRELLAVQAARIRASPPAFPTDLTACGLVLDAAGTLEGVMRVYQASLASAAEAKMSAASASAAAAPSDAGAAGVPPNVLATSIEIGGVLDAVLEPLLEVCRAGAEGLRVSDTAVYMLNNAAALQGALAPFPFTAGWVQRLASEIAAWEEALVQQVANDLLAGCGLLAKLTAMRGHDAGAAGGLPMAALPTLAVDDLRPVVAGFYAELTSPSLISLFDRVGNPRVRSRVRRDTAAVLAAAYARLYADVGEPANGYAAVCDVRALLPQTPEQVEVLLDLR
jgi:hypothetical protein